MNIDSSKPAAVYASPVAGYRIGLVLIMLAFLVSWLGGVYKGLEHEQVVKLWAANLLVLVPLGIGYAIAARKRGYRERAGGAMLIGVLLVLFSGAYLSHFKRPAGIIERQLLDAMFEQDHLHHERYDDFRSKLQEVDLKSKTAYAENIMTAQGREAARAAIRQERAVYDMLTPLTRTEFKEWDSVDAIQMGDVPELPARRVRNGERAERIVKANTALFAANETLWRTLDTVYRFAETEGASLALREEKWVYANDRQKERLQSLLADADAAFKAREESLRKALLTDAEARLQRYDELDYE